MSSNLRWLRIVGTIVVLAMVLAACGPKPAPTEAPAPPTEAPPTEAPPTEAPPTEAPPEARPFEGQKVVVVTQTGRSIGGPVEDHAPEWEAMTGGEVELQQFAFGEMFEKMITSFETGAIDYDVLIFPADWAGDFMAPGYLEPVPQAILDGIEPDDIIPLYGQRITAWGDTE